jgi:hypothetical protein
VGHMTALEPTSVGVCGPKLLFTWRCIDTHSTPYFNLELIYNIIGLQNADRFFRFESSIEAWQKFTSTFSLRPPSCPPSSMARGTFLSYQISRALLIK